MKIGLQMAHFDLGSFPGGISEDRAQILKTSMGMDSQPVATDYLSSAMSMSVSPVDAMVKEHSTIDCFVSDFNSGC